MWLDDKNAIDILRKKVVEVSYPLGEDNRHIDECKDILKSILNEDVPTDSDNIIQYNTILYWQLPIGAFQWQYKINNKLIN